MFEFIAILSEFIQLPRLFRWKFYRNRVDSLYSKIKINQSFIVLNLNIILRWIIKGDYYKISIQNRDIFIQIYPKPFYLSSRDQTVCSRMYTNVYPKLSYKLNATGRSLSVTHPIPGWSVTWQTLSKQATRGNPAGSNSTKRVGNTRTP